MEYYLDYITQIYKFVSRYYLEAIIWRTLIISILNTSVNIVSHDEEQNGSEQAKHKYHNGTNYFPRRNFIYAKSKSTIPYIVYRFLGEVFRQ